MIEITELKKIAKNYFSLWFWIDFISIFPFDEFSSLIMQGGSNDNEPT